MTLTEHSDGFVTRVQFADGGAQVVSVDDENMVLAIAN